MKRYIIGVYNRSVILTYLGAATAVFGMIMSCSLKFSVLCLIVAGVCDLFDGKVASMCSRTEKEKDYGIQIDSLADIISFVIYPVLICNKFFFDASSKGLSVLFVIACIMYIIAGIARLAWFNITTKEAREVFYGLPVTSIAFVFPLFYLVTDFTRLPNNMLSVTLMLMIMAVLFVTNFKIKKPAVSLGIAWYVLLAAVAVLGIGLVIVL